MYDRERSLKEMGLGDILDYSIEIYKKNFKKLTILALIFYAPFMLIYTLAVSHLTGEMLDIIDLLNNNAANGKFPFEIFAYYLSLLGIGFIYLIYSLTLKPVLDAAIAKILYADTVYNKELDLRTAVKESFGKFPSLFGNKVLYYLILFGVGIGAVIVFYILLFVIILGMLVAFSVPSPAVTPLSGVGIVVIILLGVALYAGLILLVSFFVLRYGFGIQAVAIENKTAVQAISRSSWLTRKSFWHIAFSCFFGIMIMFGLPTALSIGASVLIYINKELYLVLYTVSQIIGSLFYPYMVTLFTIIFINLKIKKEGLDLEVKVDKMLEAEATASEPHNGETANA